MCCLEVLEGRGRQEKIKIHNLMGKGRKQSRIQRNLHCCSLRMKRLFVSRDLTTLTKGEGEQDNREESQGKGHWGAPGLEEGDCSTRFWKTEVNCPQGHAAVLPWHPLPR